ncbi:MAG: EAL domain-containing protein [Gammaproteobacteria bacterium]|nr:EAL domain-containing protein [Gammaproteobacteria bacterium]MBU1654596.1 EAL domain-containing protein [Gammaproteobacteria bacterium]MBU1962324.1 EAL domain-containing protein [Gammaproteobacteria bacterium]
MEGGRKEMGSEDIKRESRQRLREEAERLVRTGQAGTGETGHLLHELSVHQIELEMQNEELRRTQQELDASRERYRELFELAPVGYLVIENGLVREANLTAAELLRLPRGELVERSLSRFIIPAYQDPYYLGLKRLFDRGQPQTLELELKRADGTLFWARLELTPVQGSPSCRIILSDISEQRLAEEQKRIAAVAFDARDGMLVTDAKGVILRVNGAFTQVTGYSPEEAVGKTPALLHSGRHDAGFYRAMWEAIRREDHWEGQVWNRRKDGEIYLEWLAISAVRDPQGTITHYVGHFSDISEPRLAERKLHELAYYDPLTGLPNRRLLLDRLQQAAAASERNDQYGALLLLDLDRFKNLNDSLGHPAGDRLLAGTAQRLTASLRQSDTAARLGGDEFVVLLEDLGPEEIAAATAAESIAEKLQAALEPPFQLDDGNHHLSASIGITLFCSRGQVVETLLQQAELALYQAKKDGSSNIRFFCASMQEVIDARTALEEGLRHALAKDELRLFYQPQVDYNGRPTGAEALLRWLPAGKPMVSPALFIPAAEESGLILPIGRWVLETACRQLALWGRDPATRDLQLAVNISAIQFHQPGFIDQVRAALDSSGADPSRLKLELTESLLVRELSNVIFTMRELKSIGVGFSLDDFGTGYSSLAYLKRLPLDQLKIDQSFVHGIPADPDDCAIAAAIIALGHSLRLDVIAEGVETEAQRDFLAGEGCTSYQGYLFARPGPPEAIESMAHAIPSPEEPAHDH